MQYIYYKTIPTDPKLNPNLLAFSGFGTETRTGTGFCSFMGACSTPINLINVNGTMTITDRENKIKLTIADNVVSVPILIDDNIRGRVPITIQEPQTDTGRNPHFGSLFWNSAQNQLQPQPQPPSSRTYTLSVGKLFKTTFVVRNREFSRADGFLNEEHYNYPNVIEMNLSFGIEGDMKLVNSLPTSLPAQ